jgi:hypothetical protein
MLPPAKTFSDTCDVYYNIRSKNQPMQAIFIQRDTR